MLEQRQMELIGSMQPHLRSRRSSVTNSDLRHKAKLSVARRKKKDSRGVHAKLGNHLKVTQQVLKGHGVGNDGGLVSTVNRSHQREGEVEDVAVEQGALLLQQHGQQLSVLEEKPTLKNN